MTDGAQESDDIVTEARRAASCVHIAVEPIVAEDLARILRKAAAEIERLRPSPADGGEGMREALQWFIDDIDGTHTVMRDFDANVEKARRALAALSPSPVGRK